ncbi:intracellular protein transport protein USO1 [Impatiens glandulifera]|uniref:intracellular protein transport protein USO1 n=1 Tax=Impatiens glandulifera TaxID=253017 RepID=UPI001FB155D2|nr:intracellular protein transport protein USO1 [Impatiens glandulifera]
MDEMDSLFEGMVMFNPSQLLDDNKSGDANDLHHQSQPILDSPKHSIESDHRQEEDNGSQPLDENLFSDLTLITPIEDEPRLSSSSQLDDSSIQTPSDTSGNEVISPSPSLTSVSRQLSIRKKKRAGLRIGYGRDTPSYQHQPSSPPRPSISEVESTDSPDQQEIASLPTPTDEPNSEPVESIVSRLDDNGDDALQAEVLVSSPSQSQCDPIETRFEQIKAHVAEKLGIVTELVASVSTERKSSSRRRRKAAESLSIAFVRHRELEMKLDKACEDEDFETAERVSEELASVETEKESLSAALGLAEADCDAVDDKMQKALEFQIEVEEECASLMKSFATDTTNDADEIIKSGEVASTSKINKWLSFVEDLEVKKMELEIESDIINQARLTLNDTIDDSVGDDKRESEVLYKRKEILTEELENLLALVKAKQGEIAENDDNIERVEKRISNVVSGFDEMQTSLTTKFNNLQSGLSQLETQNEVLLSMKNEMNDLSSQERERGEKLQKLAKISGDEAASYQELVKLRKTLMLLILKSREDKVRLAKTEEKLNMDVRMLRQEILAARATLQELSSTKSTIQQDIESMKHRLIFIEKRVPELEAEKKVAATARNFKEAARIANESRTLSIDKESLQVKLEEAELKLVKIEEDISINLNTLQETENHILSKENETALTRFQRLLLIAGSAKSERSAVLAFGDTEEAEILLLEAETAESEARKLQEVHKFKEDEYVDFLPEKYISMELVSNLSGEQLAEFAASAHVST